MPLWLCHTTYQTYKVLLLIFLHVYIKWNLKYMFKRYLMATRVYRQSHPYLTQGGTAPVQPILELVKGVPTLWFEHKNPLHGSTSSWHFTKRKARWPVFLLGTRTQSKPSGPKCLERLMKLAPTLCAGKYERTWTVDWLNYNYSFCVYSHVCIF